MLSKVIFNILFSSLFLLSFCSIKAQKELKYADLEFERGYYEEAISLYDKLIITPEDEKDFFYLSKQLGLSNYYLKNYSEAYIHFKNIEAKIDLLKEDEKKAYREILRNFGEYEKAKQNINKTDKNNYYISNLVDFPLQHNSSAKDSLFKIYPVNINFGSSFLGMVFIDSNNIIIPLPIKNNEQETVFYDLQKVKKTDDTIFNSTNSSKIIVDDKTIFYRGTPNNFTENKIIFSGNISEFSTYKEKNISKYNISDKATNLLHLFEYKIGTPEELVLSINDKNGNSTTPFYYNENDILFFSSDRKGGKGSFDLYYTFFKNESWTTPKLIENLNTPFDEVYPYYFNSHLYFSSKGHQNFGGLDLFSATCIIDTINQSVSTELPINLGKKINSSFDDFSMIWNSNYSGYLASNRISKNKQDNLLFFEYNPIDTLNISIYNQYETPINGIIYYYKKNNNTNKWELVDSIEHVKNEVSLIPINLKEEYKIELKKNNHQSKTIAFNKDYNYINLKKKKQELEKIILIREPSTFTLKDKKGNPIPNADIIIYSKDVKMGLFETDEEGFLSLGNELSKNKSANYTLKYIDDDGEERTLNLSAEEIASTKNPIRSSQNKTLKKTSFDITADRIKEAELTTDLNGEYQYDFNDNIDYDIEIKVIDYALKQVEFTLDQEDYEIEVGKPQYDIKIDKSKSLNAKIEKVINPSNDKVLFTLKDENGDPIPFADIAIYGKDIKIGTFDSDENGFWNINDSTLFNQEGNYTIKFKDKNGIEQSIKIDGNDILGERKELKDKNNETITNTTFDLYSDKEKLADITTDINGQYEYDFDEDINYEIEIETINYELKKVDFVFEEQDFEMESGQPQYDLKIDKSEKATITKVTDSSSNKTLLTLRDAEGEPIPFADIAIYGKNIKMGTFDTDENGLWNLNDSTKYNFDADYTVKFIDKDGKEQAIKLKGKDILESQKPLKDSNQNIITNTKIDLYSDREKLADLTTDKNGQYEYDFDEDIDYEIEIKVLDFEVKTIEFSYDQEDDFEMDRNKAQYDIKIDNNSSEIKLSKVIPLKEKEKETEKNVEKETINEVSTEKNNIARNFRSIYFEYKSSRITKEGYSILRQVARHIKENPNLKTTIYGHTDPKGSLKYNKELGLKRAKACEKYLLKKGVNKISVVSIGEKELLTPSLKSSEYSKEENKVNRRVEIIVQE